MGTAYISEKLEVLRMAGLSRLGLAEAFTQAQEALRPKLVDRIDQITARFSESQITMNQAVPMLVQAMVDISHEMCDWYAKALVATIEANNAAQTESGSANDS